LTIQDALTVTFLGITVVFLGLILTSVFISSFSFLPALVQRLRQRRLVARPPRDDRALAVDIPSEVVALIVTALEVEMRMREALMEDGMGTPSPPGRQAP